jgi:hypothetical protein
MALLPTTVINAAKVGKKAASAAKKAKNVKKKKKGRLPEGTKSRSTIRGAQRKAFPDVYADPRLLAEEAASRTAEELPAMKQLFGVNREELAGMASERGLGAESYVQPPAKARGAESAQMIMGKANTQRLVDILAEGEKYPRLSQGMDAWYEMGPAHQRLVSLLGPEAGGEEFKRLNTIIGIMSANSDVPTEMRRGTGANWLNNLNRIDDFIKYGGKQSAEGRPADMAGIPGHFAHKTAHGVPLQNYLAAGELQMQSPKVPTYIQSSLPEELGGSWRTPVGDAHWSRAVGLADTRNTKKIKGEEVVPGESVTTPELNTLTPWWAGISEEVGLKPVPAQARLWGLASGATGVESPVGASKLEMLSNMIMQRAKELGVDPESFRDYVLTGGKIAGGTGGILASMGAFAEEGEK